MHLQQCRDPLPRQKSTKDDHTTLDDHWLTMQEAGPKLHPLPQRESAPEHLNEGARETVFY